MSKWVQLLLNMEFTDYEKPFNNSERWTIKQVLWNCRVYYRYTQLIHTIYDMRQFLDYTKNQTQSSIRKGVHQRGISPKLFMLALEDISEAIAWNDKEEMLMVNNWIIYSMQMNKCKTNVTMNVDDARYNTGD